MVDAGCVIYLYKTGFGIDYEGEILYKGWRERGSRLFRMNLEDDGSNRLTPTLDPAEYNVSSGNMCQILQYSANSIYECKHKQRLIKYYHASFCSHPKQTSSAAAKARYLQGFPSLDAKAINRHIDVEYVTEMGHMRQTPSGARSSTSTTTRGRSAQALHILERDAASDNAMAMPEQEQGNVKTKKVCMMVKLADRWMASDHTGVLPRVSTRGNKCIASVPPGFPIAYWCQLLDQVNLSVNIVRPFWQNPKLSAWVGIEGEYHFDSTPIAPPGSAMLMQIKPSDCTTFGLNAKKTWYMGPCFQHF